MTGPASKRIADEGRRRVAAFAVLLCAFALFAGSAFVSSIASRERRADSEGRAVARHPAGLLWEISRRPYLSFGFRNFLADVSWLEAVQISGSTRMTAGDYDRLSRLVETCVNFDPRFKVPYLLGAVMFGDSARHASDALRLLGRGMEQHPSEWRFPFYKGYIQYFTLGDPAEGGKSLETAARVPGSPPYLPFLAARMFSEGRQPETALTFLSMMMKNESDPVRLRILERRIREVVVERDIQALEGAVETYRRRTGTSPQSLSDLQSYGLLAKIPEEPHGGKYLLSPDGTIRSSRVGQRLKVFRQK
jgi:hypothetical protein